MALSGPPPLTAAGVLLYRDSFKVRSFLTTSPAELLSFYPGVNTGLQALNFDEAGTVKEVRP